MHRRIISFCRLCSPSYISRSCARITTHLQIVDRATERSLDQSAFHKNYTAYPWLFARPVIIGCRTMASSDNSTSPPEVNEKRRNRLANEKSPYLLQHASNPVDWYPWGEEAFEKARKENKPIFLSVGYSTCHWCHVMERESFESKKIGSLLNENFVSIKVDREERPDVDRVYMTFIQATQGGGGWPMSVFLTPELKPFIGGTYFPPQDSFGRPGFATILQSIAEQWNSNRDRITNQGSKIMEAISKAIAVAPSDPNLPGTGCIQRGYQLLESKFDVDYGGFGSAPKFPQPVILNFLLRVYARYLGSMMGERALEMTLFTLRAMANGGMHDHVSQGFHRYSTDKFWHVPHFEKMLYDQGQLATVYLTAYQITRDEFFADVVRDILLYVTRDLSDKDGGFYSAEDADSFPTDTANHKLEGAFCVWTQAEVDRILADPLPSDPSKTLAELFSYHYGMEPHGNVAAHQDPHGDLKNQNVLIVRGSLEKTAEHFKMADTAEAGQLLAQCRKRMYEERQKRPRPHRDNKILTAWNGLMISGFARAAQVLDDPAYLERAVRAAQFIQSYLYNSEKGVLMRNGYRDDSGNLGIGSIEGFADDYAFLIRGLLDLFEASQDDNWLEWASQLQEKMTELFWDAEVGGYFNTTTADSSILLRMKEDQDGAEPSPNSVAASNLIRLAAFLDQKSAPRPEDIFRTFTEMLSQHPVGLPEMLCAFIQHSQTPKQIVIVGGKTAEDTQALLRCINSFYLPNKVLIVHTPDSKTFLSRQLSVLSSMKREGGKATAYVCENYTCSAPVNELEKLRGLIDPKKDLAV